MIRTLARLSLLPLVIAAAPSRAEEGDNASPEVKALSWCYSLKVAQLNHVDDNPRKVAKQVLEACSEEFDRVLESAGREDDRDEIEDRHLEIVTNQVVDWRNAPRPTFGS